MISYRHLVLGVLLGTLSAGCAGSLDSPTTTATHTDVVTLDRVVHFQSPDGADLIAEPGKYRVEAMEGTHLRLVPQTGGAPLTVQALPSTHEVSVIAPVALSIPQGQDEQHVVLVFPGGKSLDAAGSFSGVRGRGAMMTLPPWMIGQAAIQLMPTPATCPSGYIVNGELQTVKPSLTLKKTSPTLPSTSSGLSTPSLPALKPVLPSGQLPRITNLVWNFTDKVLEISGTDFTEVYTPRVGEALRHTTPRLIVNGAIVQSDAAGGFFIRAPSVKQSGCYIFVVQRRVPKQEVTQAGSVYTEELGPQSLPYQEFVSVPNPPVIQIVRSLPISSDQPLGYEMIGQDIGKRVAQLQIMAGASTNQRLADGSTAKVITADQIQTINDHTIHIRNEAVQGETNHLVIAPDVHYGTLQSNVVMASLPRRLILANVVPIPGGYILEGPEASLGSDVNQLRVTENDTLVPQAQLSLQVITGLNTNTVQIRVNNPGVNGTIVHRILTLAPGIGPSRPVTMTHIPTPTINSVQLTNYGFDILGANLGNNPTSTYLALVAGSSGIFVPSQSFPTAFFREVSNTKLAVNYGMGCQTLPLVRNTSNQVSITSGYGTFSARSSQPFFFTFPATWSQYTPVVISAIRTADGLEISGTNLGDLSEVCRLTVAVTAPNGSTRLVEGSSSPSDFLTANHTVLRIRLNPVPVGQTTVRVSRSGMSSQPLSVNLGQ